MQDAFRLLTGKLPTQGQTSALVRIIEAGRDEFAEDAEGVEMLLATTGDTPKAANLPPQEVAATLVMVRALFNVEPFITCY